MANSAVLELSLEPNQVQQPDLVIEAMMTEIRNSTSNDIVGEICCLEAQFPDHHHHHNSIKMADDPLYVMKATSDPDIMYLHQARKQPDWKEFQKAMTKEVNDQMSNGNFSIVKKSQVPKGKIILPAV